MFKNDTISHQNMKAITRFVEEVTPIVKGYPNGNNPMHLVYLQLEYSDNTGLTAKLLDFADKPVELIYEDSDNKFLFNRAIAGSNSGVFAAMRKVLKEIKHTPDEKIIMTLFSDKPGSFYKASEEDYVRVVGLTELTYSDTFTDEERETIKEACQIIASKGSQVGGRLTVYADLSGSLEIPLDHDTVEFNLWTLFGRYSCNEYAS